MQTWISLLIIFLPVLSGFLSIFLWKINQRMVKLLILSSLFLSGVCAGFSFLQLLFGNWEDETQQSRIWLILGSSNTIKLTFLVDKLSTFMATIASFLGLLIGVFSIEYMKDDEKQQRYWFFFSLFVSGMNMLVLSGNLIFLLIGWEIVGLCSFILIGHWYYKPGEEGRKARNAGFKAFIMTQIGDLGLFGFIILIYNKIGHMDFDNIAKSDGVYSNDISHALSFFLILAAFGKSAQFPFISWLSSPDDVDIDAMQGPTTVSALIHAATMVKAGVFLISRFYQLLPITLESSAEILLLIGSITAVMTGLSAITSVDIKRVLAYSTISQLSFMFVGLGLSFYFHSTNEELANSAFSAVQAHLLAHAVFKSLLFLTAGYLIHTYHNRCLEGLTGTARWKDDRTAFLGIVFGSLSLIGIPPFTGFFSKEKILAIFYEGMKDSDSSIITISYFLSVGAALLTAIYSTRLIYYLAIRKPHKVVSVDHSSPLMIWVIQILAVITLLGSLVLFFGFSNSHLEDILDEISLAYNFELFLVLGLVILSSLGAVYALQHPDWIEKVVSIPLIGKLKLVVDKGFYVDQCWEGIWRFFVQLTYKVRIIHTGNITRMMQSAVLTSIIIGAIIIGG